jgi:hypothetical protein
MRTSDCIYAVIGNMGPIEPMGVAPLFKFLVSNPEFSPTNR